MLQYQSSFLYSLPLKPPLVAEEGGVISTQSLPCALGKQSREERTSPSSSPTLPQGLTCHRYVPAFAIVHCFPSSAPDSSSSVNKAELTATEIIISSKEGGFTEIMEMVKSKPRILHVLFYFTWV